MKRAIIFGASGQDGHYLKQILEREGVHVYAFSRKECDVGVQGYVAQRIAAIMPDYIFHFAATSSTKHEALRENQYAIVDGTLFILDAVKIYCPSCKVFITGSILQLTTRGGGVYAEELSNTSAYSAQRNASLAMAQYYRHIGLDVYFGFLSYHDSPLRTSNHLAKRIAMEAKQVASGNQPHILLRDPLDEKEWNYAGDMMEAVWAQVNSNQYEAVLGSGKTATIMQYASLCLRAAMPDVPPNSIKQEFTREGPVCIETVDPRFRHHFKTTLPELAKMMVSA